MTDRSAEDFRYHLDRFPWFEPLHPPIRIKSIAYFDHLGETRAENERIRLAQDELFSCLLQDAQVMRRLQGWRARLDLPSIELAIAGFLDRVARHVGVSERGTLGRMPPRPRSDVEAFLPEWWSLQDRLYAAYQRAADIFTATHLYVHNDLQQPWRWLAYRLALHVFDEAWQRALGIRVVYTAASYQDDALWGPLVQPVDYAFQARPQETVAEAQRRLIAEAHQAAARMRGTADALPKGVFRADLEHTTRRNTRWLYRHVIRRQTGWAIAKAYHRTQGASGDHRPFPHCSCHELVRIGIMEAKRLLYLAPDRMA